MTRRALFPLALLLVAGCASARRDADARLTAGDAAGAAAAYEELLTAKRLPVDADLLLLRAATAHALAAGDEDAGSARSRELLDSLVLRFPDSPHRPTAELLRQLLARIDIGVPAAVAADGVDLVNAGEPGESGAIELVELRRTLADLHRQVDRLVAESRVNERKLRALRDEMEMLKAIDLEPAGVQPPGEPPRR